MKIMFFSVLSAFSVCSILAGNPSPPVAAVVDDAPAFQAFLPRFEESTERFINGDASAWKEHVSRSGDATIMGGFGGYERGKDVGPRYDWAAAQFRPSGAVLKVERLSSAVSGDLAYTVSIERSQALVAGQARPRPWRCALRTSSGKRTARGSCCTGTPTIWSRSRPEAVLRK